MKAKVKAIDSAACAGIPVVITSGYSTDGIIGVLRGDRIRTLFHKEAHLWFPEKDVSTRQMAVAARDASRRLQGLSSDERQKILQDVADALEANEDLIRIENEPNIYVAQRVGILGSLISHLTLKPGKSYSLAKSIRVLADMDEPIGYVQKRTELTDRLILEKTTSSLGVLLIIFESQPDL